MCGIVGIYRKRGLRIADIEKFTGMLKRCQTRGTHATGVFNSRLHYLKAPIKAEEFIQTGEYAIFKKHSVGCKYIIGHCRLSTRGKPEITSNDHPIFDDAKRFFLVHNGMLTCAKFDKTPTEVDTTIFVHVIGEKIKATRAVIDPLDISVEKAFCDVEKESTMNSSVIVVGNHDEIVFCKNKDRPLLWQNQDDEIIVFGSETTIIEEKDNGRPFNVLQDYTIQYIDLRTGEVKERELKCEKKSYSKREKTVMHGKDHDDVKTVTYTYYNQNYIGGKCFRSGRYINGKWEYDWDDEYTAYNRNASQIVKHNTMTTIQSTPVTIRPLETKQTVVIVSTNRAAKPVTLPAEDSNGKKKEEISTVTCDEVCTDCIYADINYVGDSRTFPNAEMSKEDTTLCERFAKIVKVESATNCKDFRSRF